MMRFTVFDRWGKQTGVVANVIEAVHKDELNGEDSLTLLMPSCDLAKGQRIVWRDKRGIWHEHTVSDVTDTHANGELYAAVYCENSIAELFTDYIEELRPYDVTASTALQKALSGTRWQVGTVDVTGTASASFYHTSPREAIASIVENWGGELSATIEVSGAQVASRKVNLLKRRGAANGKRFEWTKDIVSIEREVGSDDVHTALYGYGKGLEKQDEDGEATGGYERKLTFGSVNGGIDWVGDDDAKLRWGLPDGKGGIKHSFGKVEFSDCEDPAELKRLTLKALDEQKHPYVTYTADVISLSDAGYVHEGSATGDTVAIVDKELGERLQGRVLCTEEYLYNEQATVVTLGNIVRSIASVISGQQADLDWIRNHSASWDGAASISGSYINRIINSLNNTMNQTGGYTYYKPGEGIITYDRPEDRNPTMAIQIKGAGFRIANTKKSNGDWNWRTLGTGDGLVADALVAGVIRGGSNWWNLETGELLFKQGGIYDVAGKNYWDLDTGEFSLSADAEIGGKTAAKIAQDAVDAQTQRSIFNKLTNNGQTQGIYLSGGLLYINATYLKAGIISDAYGRNTWNLNTGALTTSYMTANNITAKGTFECGNTYGIKLNSTGQLAGYRNGSQVGYIDYSSSMRDVSTGVISYGIQMQCQGSLRISTPKTSMAATSDTSVTATYGYTGEGQYVKEVHDNGNGTVGWSWRTMRFINGFCTTI